MAICPECEFDALDTSDLDDGDAMNCPECGKALVVVGADEVDVAADDDDDLADDLDDIDEEAESEEKDFDD